MAEYTPHPNWHTMSADERTSWVISEMLSALTSERNYEAAMNKMLDMMSMVIHTDRMSVFVCGETETRIPFEKCDEGVQSLRGTAFEVRREEINRWFARIGDKPMALVPDVSIIRKFSEPLYAWFEDNGITDFMAAPFYNDEVIVGFLGAYNVHLDKTVDLDRLFSAVSTFIGARIENRRLIKRLEWAGEHDPLTGLLDRRGSEVAIRKFHAENHDAPLAMLLIDLDDFKRINDVYGHNAGDEALCVVAKAMADVFPESAFLCRNGGDEFLVALAGDDAGNADSLAEAFSSLKLEFEVEGERRPMTCSIGYALYPEHVSNVNKLHSKADAALYAVKMAGKSGFQKYTDDAEAHYRSQLGFSAHDIVENVPYAMLVHKADEECALLFASAQLTRLLGCDSLHELMQFSGGSFKGIVHPDDRDRIHAYYKHIADEGDTDVSGRIGYRMLTQSGEAINVRAIARFVRIEDVGEVFYTLFMLADR